MHGPFNTRSRGSSLITGALAPLNPPVTQLALHGGRKIADFCASSHNKDEGSA